ncbi:hypothetical protein [Streptomyces sp. NPDC001507]|uniref:hypothetical protein n=1 Tax=Streptomyces sp. NPDC001507 TaxID=3364579 RepID=UPI0036CE2492
MYVDGTSDKTIAAQLTPEGTPLPLRPRRNPQPHRKKTAWQAGAARAILINPRCPATRSGTSSARRSNSPSTPAWTAPGPSTSGRTLSAGLWTDGSQKPSPPTGSPPPSPPSPTPARQRTLPSRSHRSRHRPAQRSRSTSGVSPATGPPSKPAPTPAIVTQRINEAQTDKETARKGQATSPAATPKRETPPSADQILEITERFGDIAQRVQATDAEKKSPLYEALGITISYEYASRAATVRSRSSSAYR